MKFAVGLLLSLALQDAPLQWKLKKDQVFTLTSRSRVTTSIRWDGEPRFKEKRQDDASYRAQVTSIDDEGRATIALSVSSYLFDVDRGDMRVIVRSKRQDDGEPDLTVQIDAPKWNDVQKQTADQVFRRTFTNLYKKFSIEATVDKSGALSQVKPVGDPFDGIETETEELRILVATARDMVNSREMAATLAAQAFLSVPEKTGEPWDTTRSLAMQGMDLDGKFKASVKSTSDGSAQIVEKGQFTVNAKRFGDKLVEVTKLFVKEAEAEAAMNAAVWPVEMTWWFGIDAGRVATFNLKGTFSYDGTLKGKIRGKEAESKIEVEHDVNLTLRWDAP